MIEVLGVREQSEDTASVNTNLDFTEQVSENKKEETNPMLASKDKKDGFGESNPFKPKKDGKKKKDTFAEQPKKDKKVNKKVVIISTVEFLS